MATRFDPSRLAAYAGGDAALTRELIAIFFASAAQAVADHARADHMGAGQAEQRRQVWHKLKGAALAIGADRLAALCEHEERADRGPEGRAAIGAEIAALEKLLVP